MSMYAITRSVQVATAPERVHALVADLRAWMRWSPWADLDPEQTREYSGPSSGEGAFYEWQGRGKVGGGNMMIASATPSAIDIRLVLTHPWRINCPMRFEFVPVDGGTRVTWTTEGERRGLQRLAAVVLRPEVSIAQDMESGLARLKTVAESRR